MSDIKAVNNPPKKRQTKDSMTPEQWSHRLQITKEGSKRYREKKREQKLEILEQKEKLYKLYLEGKIIIIKDKDKDNDN
jgi:hypothetical protein